LVLLIAGDLLFMGLHLLHIYSREVADLGFSDNRFSLYQDAGFGELYQYPKTFLIVLLLIGLSLRPARRSYLIWAGLFLYLLLDDSLRLHERLGRTVAGQLEYIPGLQLRAQDFGELTVLAVVGLLFAVFLALAWQRSDRDFRRDSKYLTLLVGCLALFGVVLDMVHVIVRAREAAGAIGLLGVTAIGLLEDGGELVAMSLVCWYTYKLFLRRVSVRVGT
jgi:hypothetical protein